MSLSDVVHESVLETSQPVDDMSSPADMAWIPGGTFVMGSDDHYPEERPAHRVTVDGFWIDRAPVTNRQFRDFAGATGHVTFAEIPPDPAQYPGALPQMLYAASLVFVPPRQLRGLDDNVVGTLLKALDDLGITMRIGAEPFTKLRLPKLFNLRADPYERADITSNTYYDWLTSDGAGIFIASQPIVGEFLATFKEYPPSQRPSSFSIDQLVEKMQRSFESAQSN
jgi:hypothetical protein